MNSERQVYLTALSNAGYIPGLRALKRSLQQVGAKHRLIVLIPQDASALQEELNVQGLTDDFCQIRIAPPLVITPPEGITFENHYWSSTFFKLQASLCTEFDKIILLDCDMLILKNLDHLFKCPNYSAVVAGQSDKPTWVDLNSGLMVLVPDEALRAQLMDAIAPAMLRRFAQGVNIGDQDVFQEAMPDWPQREELHLPEIYNAFFFDLYIIRKRKKYSKKDFAVIHFIGKHKPWSDGLFSPENRKRLFVFLIRGQVWKMRLYLRYRKLAQK